MLSRRQAKKRHINADPGRGLLSGAGARLREPTSRVGELLRSAAGAATWPLERLLWAVERRLLWPLQGLTARVPVPSRAAGTTALGVAVLAAAAVGALALFGSDSNEGEPSQVAVAPAAAPRQAPPEEEPDGRSLEGVAPTFGSGGVAAEPAADAGDPDAPVSSDDGAGSGAESTTAPSEGGEAEATSSSGKPVPAGPAAMKVARRFSQAFVLYEIGERAGRAMEVFAETATPQLATALAERPPRQPEGTEVPRARVLNLVPGPRQGRSYTVSASLLRVGVTSELRLEMRNQAGNWVVTDVRG